MQYFRCITGLFAYSFTSCKPYSAKLKPLTPNRPQQAFRSQTPTTQLYRSDFVVLVRTSYGSGSVFGASPCSSSYCLSARAVSAQFLAASLSASRRSTAIASRSCTRVIILLAKMRSSSRRPELMVHPQIVMYFVTLRPPTPRESGAKRQTPDVRRTINS